MALLVFLSDFPEPVIPETDSSSFKEDFKDSTISTTTDANYKITRPRASRMPGSWSYTYRGVTEEQYFALIDFWRLVNGTAGMFYFTPYEGPYKGIQKIVRFSAKGDWQPYYEGYRGSLSFEEV